MCNIYVFLDVDHFFKFLLNLLKYCFCSLYSGLLLLFMLWFYGHEACEIPDPGSEIEPAPAELKYHWSTRETSWEYNTLNSF